MTKKEKFYEVTRDDQGNLVEVLVRGTNGQTVVIGSGQGESYAAKSAIMAAGDFFKFRRYEHPETGVGLHFYATKASNNFFGIGIAAISVDYDGNKYPVPSLEDYPLGWASLNVRNGRYYLTPFTETEALTRSRKHDMIDGILKGYEFQVRVRPFAAWMEEVLKTWEETDMAKANAMRDAGIAKRQLNRQLQAVVTTKNVEKQAISDEAINLVVKSTGEVVDITKHAPCVVNVHDRRGVVVSVNWDKSAHARCRLQEVSTRGYRVEIQDKAK